MTMITFIAGLIILIAGGAVYGKVARKYLNLMIEQLRQ